MAKLVICFLVATILCAYICAAEEEAIAVKGDAIESDHLRFVREASADPDPKHKGKGYKGYKGHDKGYDKGYDKGHKGHKGHHH